MENKIHLRKVETNNLKSIDVDIPINEITVVTGVSGSGKSSLVFDTLYAEAYRRFVDSLSSYARQYLKTMPKPIVETIENLPPAIAVKQSRASSNQRSTVGTLTELSHSLQVLFSKLSKIKCYSCGRDVDKDTPKSIFDFLFSNIETKASLMILAPLKKWKSLNGKVLKQQLMEQGFSRVYKDGETAKLKDISDGSLFESSIVIDRVSLGDEERNRIVESLETAFKLGRDECKVVSEKSDYKFSAKEMCSYCDITFIKPSLSLFSFNHPLGACDHCQGYGRVPFLDWNKVIPDKSSSISEKGLAPLNFGSHAEYYKEIMKSAKKYKISTQKTFDQYTEREWLWLKEGLDSEFGGMKEYFDWLQSKKYKAHYRIHSARYYKYVQCPTCEGNRYSKDVLSYKISEKNISEVHQLNATQLKRWLEGFLPGLKKKNPDLEKALSEVLVEMQSRIKYLLKVGLGYLSLNRVSSTLSGGELQRIHMANCIGSSLTDTLYCLDEPSSGLHARDAERLKEVIWDLRDHGNTVVMVEHDRQLIESGDFLLEIGPESGHRGGAVNYQGGVKSFPGENPKYEEKAERAFASFIELQGAKTHNLKNVDVKFPLASITVVCGVSGSGKTSLVQHTLLPMLQAVLKGESTKEIEAQSIGPSSSLKKIQEVMMVDQKALSRSSRSTIATYLGIFDIIRKLFSQQERAKALGLGAGAFSFNVPGGRCENCKGLGLVSEDLSFLGEVKVRCPECDGKRFTQKVLSVKVRSKNLLEILSLTVQETFELFRDVDEIRKILEPVIQLGLGYLTLGQATHSFSGGEAQRLKLLNLLKDTGGASSQKKLLIFDEPTTGLSDQDVYVLWKHLDFLAQKGHTVLVIEHHLDMIRHSDWLVEIGPDAADQGGTVVYQGPPKHISSASSSRTAPYLK